MEKWKKCFKLLLLKKIEYMQNTVAQTAEIVLCQLQNKLSSKPCTMLKNINRLKEIATIEISYQLTSVRYKEPPLLQGGRKNQKRNA